MSTVREFAEEFDVVVIGYGFAGAMAAITATDNGATVLLCEKEANPGGISVCSGGWFRSAHDADKAFEYLQATNAGRTPDDVLRVLADGMTVIENDIRHLAAVSKADINVSEKGGNYPLPGVDTFYHVNIINVPGCEDLSKTYPHIMTSPSACGWRMFKVMEDNIARRPIEVRLEFAAHRLITNDLHEVVGVWFNSKKHGLVAINARRGVVLACGGFEADEKMKLQYWEKAPVLTATSVSNTGDGIRMAQELGADLWHMWHFHGSYGFKHPNPDYPVAIRVKRLPDWFPGRENAVSVRMSWIIVDQDGRRYMNECTPYTQDTSHRPMELFDSVRQIFPRIPSYLIYDEIGRQEYRIGAPTYNQKGHAFKWSNDNLKEIELGIIKRANSVDELAKVIGANPSTLRESLDDWNRQCQNGRDVDFGRPPGSMMAVKTPPFYVGEIWPVVSNTQGGPVHNASQQIINVFGEPIPRLFAAGELGSAFGYLYLSGANLSECMVTGKIAGKNAASLAGWDAFSISGKRAPNRPLRVET
jgi:succinate dehydrogenase/fumarate reductase flavoprotein subunit